MNRVSVLFLLLSLCLKFQAQIVTPEVASQVAENFFYESEKVLKSAPTKSKLKMPQTVEYMGRPIYYSFNADDGDGFILVSANYGFYPILGFSYEGSFDQDDHPPGLFELLEVYKNQMIKSIKGTGVPEDQYKTLWAQYSRSSSKLFLESDTTVKEVKPLLDTKWNSGCLYNSHCPEDDLGPCGHVKVGCVAVAMAQILKYYSSTEQPSHSAYYTHDDYGLLSVDFDSVTYHWDRMPDHIDIENDDVAQFLYHCGVSIHMNYSPTFSGASSQRAGNALIYHFHYSGKIEEISNFDNYYSSERWGKVIRKELDNFRPVFCAGDPPKHGKGHAYVVDGYYGDELLHYNWGWGGKNDGYFAVGAPIAFIGVQPDTCENDTLKPNPVRNPSYLVDDDSIFVTWDMPAVAADGDYASQFCLIKDNAPELILYGPEYHFKWESTGAYKIQLQAYDDCRIPSDSVTPLVVIVPDTVNYRPRIDGFFPSYSDTIPVYSGVKKIFSIDYSDPNKDSLSFEWYIDNIPIPEIASSRLVYDFREMEQGMHSITVKVSDHQLSKEKSWILKKVCSDISIIDDKDSLVMDGGWYEREVTDALGQSIQVAGSSKSDYPSAQYNFLPEKTGSCALSVYIPDLKEYYRIADSVIYLLRINHLAVDTFIINQESERGKWVYLGEIDLLSDVQVSVIVINSRTGYGTKPHVIDAMKFEYFDAIDNEPPFLSILDSPSQGGYIKTISSETGWIYLVPEETEKDLAVIKRVCLDSAMAISKTIVSISLGDENNGTLWLYAMDIHGNLSDPIAINTMGIDHEAGERFSTYPNPVFDMLTIRGNTSGCYSLEISSLNGGIIYSQTVTGQTHVLNLSSFPKGIYLITIKSKYFTATKKIVKLSD